MPNVCERRVCATMSVPRSAVRERATKPRVPVVDDVLAARLQRLITEHPTFGYRRLWALLRFHEGLRVNRRAVYRVLVLKGWCVHQRRMTPRPRVQGRRSRATRSNERRAMDLTHIDCGADGWAHFAAVIDCHRKLPRPGYHAMLDSPGRSGREHAEVAVHGGADRRDLEGG